MLAHVCLSEERREPCRSARNVLWAAAEFSTVFFSLSFSFSLSHVPPKPCKNPGDPRQWVDLVRVWRGV